MPGLITGVRPMLHASATSSATTEVGRSFIRVLPSPRCTKASRNPVQAFTSNSRSGRSIFGEHRRGPLAQPGQGLRLAEDAELGVQPFNRQSHAALGSGHHSPIRCPRPPPAVRRSAASRVQHRGRAPPGARAPARRASARQDVLRAPPPTPGRRAAGAGVGPAVRGDGEHVARCSAPGAAAPARTPRTRPGPPRPAADRVVIHRLRFHAGGTSSASISRGSSGLILTFRRASAGRPGPPARTFAPPARRDQRLRFAQQRQERAHRARSGRPARRASRRRPSVVVLGHQRLDQWPPRPSTASRGATSSTAAHAAATSRSAASLEAAVQLPNRASRGPARAPATPSPAAAASTAVPCPSSASPG